MPRHSNRATSSPAASQDAACSTSGGSSSASAATAAFSFRPAAAAEEVALPATLERGRENEVKGKRELAFDCPRTLGKEPLFINKNPTNHKSDNPACRTKKCTV